MSDINFFQFSTPPSADLPKVPYQFSSHYVTMSDGVQLAVDVYLPNNYKEEDGIKYPTVLHLTRYNRRYKIKWPASWMGAQSINIRSMKLVHRFVTIPVAESSSNSIPYAVVSVDVRGTGASFGTRPYDMAPRETKDYQEILRWVTDQQWCAPKKVCSCGISYDGMAAAQLAAGDTTGNVRAVGFMFSPVNLYEDLVFPGGVKCKGFLDQYKDFTYNGERNELPKAVSFPWVFWLFNLCVLGGIGAVEGNNLNSNSENEKKLQQAISEHDNNWDMNDSIKSVAYVDDGIVTESGESVSTTQAGTTLETLRRIQENDVAVYSYGGYYDSGSIRSAMRVHAAKDNKEVGEPVHGNVRNKLTIGCWNHGARKNGSPFSHSAEPAFDIYADMKRYFDAVLCPELVQTAAAAAAAPSSSSSSLPANTVLTESPVHYFEIGTEVWKTSDVWPIPSVKWTPFVMTKGGNLSQMSSEEIQRNISEDSSDVYEVKKTGINSGFQSRWNLVEHILLKPFQFIDNSLDRLCFTSEPLEGALHVVGAPRVRVSMKPHHGRDAVLFVYLLDVDASGVVRYITEGVLRALHRKTQSPECDASNPLTALPLRSNFDRSYVRKDATPLPELEVSAIDIHLPVEPVACCFQSGHRIRIAICGACDDNFDTSQYQETLATAWELRYVGGACSLALPEKT
mmetsp:Transcript_19051/g.31874  ORF Transcript_19051/g.31874 Transcript_19051/m.31874 type:complete len:681 (+) Transcript_19051:79-2121(+)